MLKILTLVVNFINILRSAFAAKKLQSQTVSRDKLLKTLSSKKARLKCWWNWHLGYINGPFPSPSPLIFYTCFYLWFTFSNSKEYEELFVELNQNGTKMFLIYASSLIIKCWNIDSSSELSFLASESYFRRKRTNKGIKMLRYEILT